ncbi:MAG: 2-succinylbenzoate--CoA ligase [Anaerolineales bacterium]|nr:2-succinylbenzoate--CoA ligase [Anaerolineales bacterium]
MTTFVDTLKTFYETEPDRPSVTLQHPGQPDFTITYRELIERANDYAAAYARAGIKPGDVVILILQHGRDLVYSFWGAVLHGAIPSMMPFLTEKLSPERYRSDLTTLFTHSRPTGIVTYPEFETDVKTMVTESGHTVRDVFVTDRIEKQETVDFASLSGMKRDEGETVLLQHSSGSTGLQKGVALSHRAIFNHLDAYGEAIRLTRDDVIVSWLPLYHDMGLIACFILPILRGVHVIQMSPFDWVRAPYRMLQTISSYHGTLTWLPNFAYNFCAQRIRDRDLEGVNLSSWRASINTSEPVKFKSHQVFYERFKGFGLRLETLQTSYGMAENTFAVTQNDLDKLPCVEEIDRESYITDKIARPAHDDRPSIQMMSCGQPISNTSIRVVDDQGHDLPERHVGEIVLKSNCMLNEYYNRPDITKQAFLPGGWYKSGDYGYVVNNEVFVAGRKKDLIIVGGKNVYPQDLEALACEVSGVHPGRTVAFGLFDEDEGTEEVVIIAEVETDDESEHERIAGDIRKHVTKNSAIALRHVRVVGPGWVLKTSSGKVARAANKEKFIKELAASQ